MTDDIVARLRGYKRLEYYPPICSEAADEIERLRLVVEAWLKYSLRAERDIETLRAERERLRLEMSIPRDEYAMTWKNLLDRIDGLDIVEWIRAYANAYSPSDYSYPIAREVVVRSDAKWMQAAAEIERLRARVAELERFAGELDASGRKNTELAALRGTPSDGEASASEGYLHTGASVQTEKAEG